MCLLCLPMDANVHVLHPHVGFVCVSGACFRFCLWNLSWGIGLSASNFKLVLHFACAFFVNHDMFFYSEEFHFKLFLFSNGTLLICMEINYQRCALGLSSWDTRFRNSFISLENKFKYGNLCPTQSTIWFVNVIGSFHIFQN